MPQSLLSLHGLSSDFWSCSIGIWYRSAWAWPSLCLKAALPNFISPLGWWSLLKLLGFFLVVFQCISPSSSSVLHSCTNITSYPVSMRNAIRICLDEGGSFVKRSMFQFSFIFSEGILISVGRGQIKSIKTFYPDSCCFLHMYLSFLVHNKDNINSAKWWAEWIKCTLGATCICSHLGVIQSLLRKRNAPRNPANRSPEGAGGLAVPLCSPAGGFEGRITAETLAISWELQHRLLLVFDRFCWRIVLKLSLSHVGQVQSWASSALRIKGGSRAFWGVFVTYHFI